jgi:hypothetical protein
VVVVVGVEAEGAVIVVAGSSSARCAYAKDHQPCIIVMDEVH